MPYLLITPAGLVALDDSLSTLYSRTLSKEEAKQVLSDLSGGRLPQQAEDVLAALTGRGDVTVFSEEVLKALSGRIPAKLASPEEYRTVLREELLAAALGIPSEEYRKRTAEFSAQESMAGISASSERKDLLAAEGIRAIDDLDQALNLLSTRAKEWYGVHFPELQELVPDVKSYLKIASAGLREDLTEDAVKGLKGGKSVAKAAVSSMGAHWNRESWLPLKQLSDALLQMYEVREELDSYVEKAMKDAAPNLTELVGAPLGARLISLAGGLDRLARMPSSTIQVLGAEKALFRAMKTGAKPPKHGVIFQHPAIHSAPRWQRGKLARAVAAKIALAARIDAFGAGRLEPSIKRDLDEKIKKISSSPPPPRKPQQRPTWRKKGRR